MKNIWKLTLLSALVLGSGMLAGCREEEELNLAGYPDVEVGVVIADAENAAEATVKATYAAGTGELQLDGALTRTYIFSLSTPSPKDASFVVEPIFSNIPEELVTISETELFIPAGSISASVTVGLVDENTSFMADEYTAQTYELGVRLISADGSQLELTQTEARLKIEKEAYVSVASVQGVDGSTSAEFRRAYIEGGIINTDPISYEYRVVLDKPALHDLTFTVSSTGAPENSGERFSASQLTVTAGKLESTSTVWSLTDDFLEVDDQPFECMVQLTAALAGDETAAVMSEEQGSCAISVLKVFDRMTFLSALDPSWVEFDYSSWTVDPASIGNKLFDNNTMTYIYDESFVIDMQEVKTVYGLSFRGASDYVGYVPRIYRVSGSVDGVDWSSWGEMDRYDAPTDSFTPLYIALVRPADVRYLKFEVVEANYWNFAEFEVYGKN